MSTVTHKNQPAIHATNGHVYDGYKTPYTISKLLWTADIEAWISRRLLSPCLHVCCGKSAIGDIRLDMFETDVSVCGDAARLPFRQDSFDSVLIDPPYNGVFQWNHDMLSELARVARHRIVFQHWFIPADRKQRYKKNHRFRLVEMAAWQPQTYFGRANIISVFDGLEMLIT